MGVSRNITLEVYTKLETSYCLIREILLGLWFKDEEFSVRTFYKDSTDNDDLTDFMNFYKIEQILDERDSLFKRNEITVNVDELNEGLIIKSKKLTNSFNSDMKFELYFSPGGNHTLEKFSRNTDFSYYLNLILPQIEKIGHTTKIECLDFG